MSETKQLQKKEWVKEWMSKYINLDIYICEDCNRDITDEIDEELIEKWDSQGGFDAIICKICYEEGY